MAQSDTPMNRFALVTLSLIPCLIFAQDTAIDGVTFVHRPGVLFAPVRELGDALGLAVRFEASTKTTFLADQKIPSAVEFLADGTRLMPVRDLAETNGAQVTWDASANTALVSLNGKTQAVKWGAKRVEIDKSNQTLSAWQGDRKVMETRVSTGRIGYSTPNGKFTAGPYKAPMHRSSIYDQAPMPWSVQITGNIFVHGYATVPSSPASHGCIRLPLAGINPAKWFYNWVDLGTPVTISGEWKR